MLIHLDNKYYECIKSGAKTIEMRLFDEKRRKLHVGDIIEFEDRKTGDILKTKVINLHIVPSFKELYEMFPKEKLGYLENEEASFEDMEQFYSKEDILKYGVVGIEISLVK